MLECRQNCWTICCFNSGVRAIPPGPATTADVPALITGLDDGVGAGVRNASWAKRKVKVSLQCIKEIGNIFPKHIYDFNEVA